MERQRETETDTKRSGKSGLSIMNGSDPDVTGQFNPQRNDLANAT